MEPLELLKLSTLEELEAIIAKGINSFVDTGNALREIRDRGTDGSRLYHTLGFKTFEDYCQKRWGWSRFRSYQLIGAAEVADNLLTIVNKPVNEAQSRELARLPPDLQRELAATIDFTNTTAKQIHDRAEEMLPMKSKTKTKANPPMESAWAAGEAIKLKSAVLKVAAARQPITRLDFYGGLGNIKAATDNRRRQNIIKPLMMLPWLKLDSLANGKVRVTIDHGLEEICRQRRNGGELPTEFIRRLFDEMMRRRKEAHLANKNRSWNPDVIAKADLMDILVWIEAEIQTYLAGPPVNRREKAKQPPQSGNGAQHDNETQIGNGAADAGTSTPV
jgi:hypothetical protein